MKHLLSILVLFLFAFVKLDAQNLMIVHQGNGTQLQIPLESIDSVRFVPFPPPLLQKIFQNNGNVLSVAVADIDSITYSLPNVQDLAQITTQAVTVLSATAAYGGGTVISNGSSPVTQRGVCWSTSPNPTLANNFTVDGSGNGSFGSSILPLQTATTYYVRAYAVNTSGTAYGNVQSFTTPNASGAGALATISTNNLVYTDGLTATCGGNITADGGLAVTARGVCWAVGTTPTINNNISVDGIGGGSFNSTLTNLMPGTTYFVRAYATNDAGTAYGITYGFSTHNLPVLTTTAASNVTFYSANSGGTFTSVSGTSIQQKGVCYSLNADPDITDMITNSGSGFSAFNSTPVALEPDQTYYLKSYAITGLGVIYGDEIQFTTLAETPPNITTALIPAGTFTMGSPNTEPYRASDEAQHQVTVSAFRMSVHEITNAQYATFLNANGIGLNGLHPTGAYPGQSLISNCGGNSLSFYGGLWHAPAGKEDFPVHCVNWYGAAEFATYAGGRLPTEAEWEYACRGGTNTPFNTGNCLDYTQANYSWQSPYSDCSNANTNSPGDTQAVDSYAPNAYGIYNIHGNVSEWCSDWYGAYDTAAQNNPTGPSSGESRVLRGGVYYGPALLCRSARRNSLAPDYWGNFQVGFRLAFQP